MIEGVSIDTRTRCERCLFVALEGGASDGHRYLGDAIARGAAGLLVSHAHRDEAAAAGSVPVFAVRDTLAGLQAIASAYRALVNPRVIAVTGSTGKTGTKDFITSVLSRRFNVYATPGNLNNHIGLPLTILGMEGSEDICVTEMGANHRREIARLCEIARPEIGAVTNIGPVHLEFFGSPKGVAAAKAELVESLPPTGTAVLPADDEFVDYLRGRAKARVVTFGYSEAADRRITGVERREGPGYRFLAGGIPIEVPRYGAHHILNAAAAAAVCSIAGATPDEIASGVAASPVEPGRGIPYDVGGILFVDDSYNANPASLRAGLEAFMEMPVAGKRWLVLGDMLELGASSAELHREAGIVVGRSKVDGILTVGAETVELSRAAAEQRKSPDRITHFLDTQTLAAYLNERLAPGDAVFLKGSHAMHIEKVLEAIETARGVAKRRAD